MAHPLIIHSDQSESLTIGYPDLREEIIDYDPYEEVTSSIFAKNEIEGSLNKEFLELKEIWLMETMFDSGYASMVNHPAFLKIVSWGEDIIPSLVEDMVNAGTPWYYALSIITDENPVSEDNMGKHKYVIEDWRGWAEQNCFI